MSVTSLNEKRFIENQIKGLSGKYFDYWTGLNDLDAEGFHTWKDQSPLVLTNWYKNNPKLNSRE